MNTGSFGVYQHWHFQPPWGDMNVHFPALLNTAKTSPIPQGIPQGTSQKYHVYTFKSFRNVFLFHPNQKKLEKEGYVQEWKADR